MSTPAAAQSDRGPGCPSNFDCSRRIEKLLARGVDQSESLRSLVESLGAHRGVDLILRFRRQKPDLNARSFIEVRGVYVREHGQMGRRVTGVSGELTIPWVAYGHRQIELLAHELQHVRLLLEATIASDTAESEQAAIRFEEIVRGELEASRAEAFDSAGPSPRRQLVVPRRHQA